MTVLFSIVFAFVLSIVLTWTMRHVAVRCGWLSIPNDRSSHTAPIPSGGGIAIALVFFTALLFLRAQRLISQDIVVALLGGGLLIVLVGWINDRRHLPVLVRLFVQSLAGAWALFSLGGFSSLHIGFGTLPLGMWGSVLALLWVLVVSNIYNFIDGIDGLAAGGAVLIGIMGGLFLVAADGGELARVSFLLAASTAGFLLWNWEPAKIFMGDAGSVLLGFTFSVLALAGEERFGLPALFWALFLLVFLCDALYTTIARFFQGKRWYAAHHEFTYQKAVERGYTHAQVTTRALALIGICGLIAAVVAQYRVILLPALVLCSLSLWLLWMYFHPRSQRVV